MEEEDGGGWRRMEEEENGRDRARETETTDKGCHSLVKHLKTV